MFGTMIIAFILMLIVSWAVNFIPQIVFQNDKHRSTILSMVIYVCLGIFLQSFAFAGLLWLDFDSEVCLVLWLLGTGSLCGGIAEIIYHTLYENKAEERANMEAILKHLAVLSGGEASKEVTKEVKFGHCAHCGEKLPAGAKICPECGVPVQHTPQTTKFCPHCGTNIRPGTEKCPSCNKYI